MRGGACQGEDERLGTTCTVAGVLGILATTVHEANDVELEEELAQGMNDDSVRVRACVLGVGAAVGADQGKAEKVKGMGRVGRTPACAAYPPSTYPQPASPRSERLAESL